MKSIDLSIALNMVDDKILEETDKVRSEQKPLKNKLMKIKALAACIALAVFIGAVGIYKANIKTSPEPLPMLTLGSDIMDGMGFEGYLVQDISELINENPWDESIKLTTLPVYKNPVTYNERQRPANADFDKMKEYLFEIASRLGLDSSTLTVTDDTPNDETRQKITEKLISAGGDVPEGYFDPTRLEVISGDVTIRVFPEMASVIIFEPSLELQNGIKYSYYPEYDDCLNAAEYFKEQFKEVIGFKSPVININGGDRDIYNQRRLNISFFEDSDDYIERLLNYNFNQVSFTIDDDGNLHSILFHNANLSQKVGDYPIISKDQAFEKLIKGEYITSATAWVVTSKEYVKKVELVYRQDRYFMPYYKFYVEVPEKLNEYEGVALKTYAAYYVPAVKSEYISEGQLWSGAFNSPDAG